MIRDKGKTTITSIVATPVSVPVREDWLEVKPAIDAAAVRYILRAGTDKGFVGLGETIDGVTPHQLRHSAAALVDIHLNQLHPAWLPIPHDAAYGAFELLVYDILGQAFGMPVHQLIAGRSRTSVGCRAPLAGRSPSDAAAAAVRAASRGYRAGVIHAAGHDIIDAVAAVREEVGPAFAIVVNAADLRVSNAAARQVLAELAAHDVLAVEDALPHNQWGDYASLRQGRCPLLSLTVEMNNRSPKNSSEQQRVWLDAMCAEVDGLMFNGPLAHSVRMADAAHLLGRRSGMAGNCDLGILEVGRLHAAAAAPGCVWFSDIAGRLVREHDLLTEPLEISDGEAVVGVEPGLGVELHVDALEKYRVGADLELARA